MKFLKQKNISRYSVSDQTLFVNQYGRGVMNYVGGLRLPKGTEAQRPQETDVRTLGGADGFIRYNTDTNTIEALIDGIWEVVRAPGANTITKQTLGPGDGVEQIFGPLLTDFEYKFTADINNLIVLVENVWQIAGTNHVLIQNPCDVTATVISFDQATSTISSSNTSVAHFKNSGFFEGQEIVVSGSANNDGTYIIDSVSASEIVVEESLTDESAGASVSIVGNSPLSSSPYGEGFFLKFDDADIVGKFVTVYYGYAN